MVRMSCNNDCFNCIYSDCIEDRLTKEEIGKQDALDKEIRFLRLDTNEQKKKKSQKKYEQSEKGEIRRDFYEQSDKGKGRKDKYFKSQKGKEALKKYTSSEKGKATRERYEMSEKRKESRKRWNEEHRKQRKEYFRLYHQKRKLKSSIC